MLYDVAAADEPTRRWEGVALGLYRKMRVRVATLDGDTRRGSTSSTATRAACRRRATSGWSPTPPRQRARPTTTSPSSGPALGVTSSDRRPAGEHDRRRRRRRAPAELTGAETHDVALVMGSGWVPAADALGAADAEFPVTELPGFPPPAVAGHGGRIRSVDAGGKRVLVFLGRTHFYEGRGVAAVVHGVRTAVAAGCKTVVLTNGCGGLRDGMRPGQPVLISDHLNLTATSPMTGANFVDLTDLYSPRFARCARRSTRPWTRASTSSSPARTTRPRPRSAWSACSAATWSACRPCWRPSPPARPARRSSASRWSPTSPPA